MATSVVADKENYVPPPTIDPTDNVKDLVKEVVIRLDLLRESERDRSVEQREADRRWVDSEMRHINHILELRAEYLKDLRVAEANRIDAIRAVDVGAVAIATQRASDQASVLAAQVQASAEALRVQLQNTATLFKSQLDQTTQQLSDRLTSVEKFQYEGKGSAGSIPPALSDQLDRLTAQVAALKESRDRNEGRSGISAPLLATIVAAVVGFAVFILQRIAMGG